MKKTLTITIEIEGGTHKFTLTDSTGLKRECDSLVLAAGNKKEHEVYTFGWGHPVNAAWSLGEGLARSQGREWWDSLIFCVTREMAYRCVPIDKTTVEDLLERWDKEDEFKEKPRTN